MPNTTYFGDYPFPTDPEAAGAPADFMALAEALDSHTVLFATSEADRDANYTGLPAGGLVSCAALKTVWRSLGGTPTVWERVSYDSGWVTAGFTYPTGWAADTARIRNRNGVIEMVVSVERIGSDLVAASDGNLNDTNMVIIPAAFRPASGSRFGRGYYGQKGLSFYASALGNVVLTDALPGAVIPTGATVQLSLTWLEG